MKFEFRARTNRRREKGALAWEREPQRRIPFPDPFFLDRGVGSSILASLSEAGGNDRHKSWSKPLPPRSKTCESRLPECVHVFIAVQICGQTQNVRASQEFLIFHHLPKICTTQSFSNSAVCSDLELSSPGSGNSLFPIFDEFHLDAR